MTRSCGMRRGVGTKSRATSSMACTGWTVTLLAGIHTTSTSPAGPSRRPKMIAAVVFLNFIVVDTSRLAIRFVAELGKLTTPWSGAALVARDGEWGRAEREPWRSRACA